ncbi:DUF4435 domain-containing protein [Polaromonas jejuensis]|uniref:DUF4435 domain-containing protein n=1 Tax=Polaromonas jejuensis TaxID=457502 RepID=A0ABW0QET1_9BURK|nr:DUF4435 domain-containing protein [Polaromonas jejuensis]
MEQPKQVTVDNMVERLREKRDAPAVLKTRLAAIRAHAADVLVFAFEGQEDKTVYYHWFKQVAPLLTYEVIVCNGKGKVLAFRELLQRDLTNLKERVFFFVDHDFDGLRGQAPDADIYVTDTYSVENHLVNKKVLDDLLKVELHCDGEPAVRAAVSAKSLALYERFLDVTKPLNQRIFVAKKAGIKNVKPWPNRINALAKVAIDDVTASDEQMTVVIALEREPTEEELTKFAEAFAELEPRSQYRGKFALAFFGRLLEVLAEDRGCPAPVLFAGLPSRGANGRLPLDTIASKSIAPQPFQQFVDALLGTLENPPLPADG